MAMYDGKAFGVCARSLRTENSSKADGAMSQFDVLLMVCEGSPTRAFCHLGGGVGFTLDETVAEAVRSVGADRKIGSLKRACKHGLNDYERNAGVS